jgi:hypothetical protein
MLAPVVIHAYLVEIGNTSHRLQGCFVVDVDLQVEIFIFISFLSFLFVTLNLSTYS